jgi:hypothetical protein
MVAKWIFTRHFSFTSPVTCSLTRCAMAMATVGSSRGPQHVGARAPNPEGEGARDRPEHARPSRVGLGRNTSRAPVTTADVLREAEQITEEAS